jgi:heterodisulfide reductase subunit B2
MPAYSYFPGCSLTGMGKPYDESVRAVFNNLGVALEEVPDWNCCGATSYMSVDEEKAVTLAARNLALAEKMKKELMAPCSACYLVLLKAGRLMAKYPETADRTAARLKRVDLAYHGMVTVKHPLQILVDDIAPEVLQSKVKNPLKGYRVAPYYGCQIVRPFAAFDDARNPVKMDRLLEMMGAQVVDYPLKTRCCGASLMGTIEEVAVRLSFHLLKAAKDRGANVIVTACPLCQFNLEGYQDQMKRRFHEDVRLPVVYFSQLVGIAMGLKPRALGLQRNFVTAPPLPAA